MLSNINLRTIIFPREKYAFGFIIFFSPLSLFLVNPLRLSAIYYFINVDTENDNL